MKTYPLANGFAIVKYAGLDKWHIVRASGPISGKPWELVFSLHMIPECSSFSFGGNQRIEEIRFFTVPVDIRVQVCKNCIRVYNAERMNEVAPTLLLPLNTGCVEVESNGVIYYIPQNDYNEVRLFMSAPMQKIKAIKYLRDEVIPGLGLREAKYLAEEIGYKIRYGKETGNG